VGCLHQQWCTLNAEQVKTSVFQKKGGGGLQTEKAYFETNRQEAHFWVAKKWKLIFGTFKGF
jgi:hypothetical protein